MKKSRKKDIPQKPVAHEKLTGTVAERLHIMRTEREAKIAAANKIGRKSR